MRRNLTKPTGIYSVIYMYIEMRSETEWRAQSVQQANTLAVFSNSSIISLYDHITG